MIDSRFCVYDVEVQHAPGLEEGYTWEDPEGMGFASAVTYDYASGRYHFYLRNQKDDLLRQLHGRVAVTWNGIQFDSKVILGTDRIFSSGTGITARKNPPEGEEYWFYNYDMLLEYAKSLAMISDNEKGLVLLNDKMYRAHLDNVAQFTLRIRKSGHGAEAPGMWQRGEYARLLEYNLQDVRVTRFLFEHVYKYKYLVNGYGQAVKFK